MLSSHLFLCLLLPLLSSGTVPCRVVFARPKDFIIIIIIIIITIIIIMFVEHQNATFCGISVLTISSCVFLL